MKTKQWHQMDTKEKSEAVRRGAESGLSARKIADTIIGATRNAVIGIAHRNRIQLKGSVPKAKLKTPAKTPPEPTSSMHDVEAAPAKQVSERILKIQNAKLKASKVPTPVAKENAEEASVADILPFKKPVGPVNILDLTHRTCRWPLNESYRGVPVEQMMFCGNFAGDGSVYCASCSSKSYDGPVKVWAMSDPAAPKKKEKRPFLRWLR